MDSTSARRILLPFKDKPVLDLHASAAAIDVFPVEPGEQPRIEAADARNDQLVELHEQGDTVHVRIGAPDLRWFPFFGAGSQLALRLYVPSDVRARLRSDVGRIRVERLEGCDLELATHAGQLWVRNTRGRLTLRADAGQIRADDVGGSLDVDSGAGEVRLGISALDSGAHRVHSSMGAVRVQLAAGIKVRVETRTSLGSVRNRFPSSAEAEAVLSLQAELGSVQVEEGVAFDDPKHGDGTDWRKQWSAPGWGPTPDAQRSEEVKRILTLIELGKINASEGERMLRALNNR